ncbi:MAG: hypothetical protein EA369_04915 [Bradymonadales bacterium]|nr:MAG: hypothetical protein EA369_04915 [Bradymonadales bacterium]
MPLNFFHESLKIPLKARLVLIEDSSTSRASAQKLIQLLGLALCLLLGTACQSARSPDSAHAAAASAGGSDASVSELQSFFWEILSQAETRLQEVIDAQFFTGVNPAFSSGQVEMRAVERRLSVGLAPKPPESEQKALLLKAHEELLGVLKSLSGEQGLDRRDQAYFRQLAMELEQSLMRLSFD